jgi:Uma2 family endonuclease
MASPAPKRWTIADFLAWSDGTDRRYELIDGAPLAMAPPSEAHGTIVMNLGSALNAQLQPPCRVVGEAGILLPDRDDTWYQADLAITCTPPEHGRSHVEAPILIAEILSPSTALHDRGLKLVDYCRLPSVREILLVSSTDSSIQYWRRDGARWLVETLIGEAALTLETVRTPIHLATIYANSGTPAQSVRT